MTEEDELEARFYKAVYKDFGRRVLKQDFGRDNPVLKMDDGTPLYFNPTQAQYVRDHFEKHKDELEE